MVLCSMACLMYIVLLIMSPVLPLSQQYSVTCTLFCGVTCNMCSLHIMIIIKLAIRHMSSCQSQSLSKDRTIAS